MKNYLKLKIFITLFLALKIIPNNNLNKNENNDFYLNELDYENTQNFNYIDTDLDLDFDAYDLDYDETGANPNNYNKNRSSINFSDKLVLALNTIDLIKVVDKNLFIRTSNLNSRNILDTPYFSITQSKKAKKNLFGISFFYNQFNNLNINTNKFKNNNVIGSYLDLTNPDFIEALENSKETLAASIPNATSLVFTDILSPFANIRVEERRLGAVLNYNKKIFKNTAIDIKYPFFYIEKNYNLALKHRNALENNEFIKSIADSVNNTNGNIQSQTEQKKSQETAITKFFFNHFFMDQLGTGTFEAIISKKLFSISSLKVKAGIIFDLPLDFSIQKGLKGAYLEPNINPKILRFSDLIFYNETTDNEDYYQDAPAILSNYFLTSLDNISSQLLSSELGYKTLGIGANINTKWTIFNKLIVFENLKLNSSYSLKYLFPKTMLKYFVKKETPGAVINEFETQCDLGGNVSNTGPNQYYDAALNIFETVLYERLFPQFFLTTIAPQFIFITNSNLEFKILNLDFTIGANFWYKSKETFSSIDTTTIIKNKLDIEKAQNFSASQTKINFKISKKISKIYFEIFGDYTLSNNGLGEDFLIGLNINTKF